MTIDQDKTDPIVIAGAARTAMGGFQGDFSAVAAPALGADGLQAAGGKDILKSLHGPSPQVNPVAPGQAC